MENSSWGAFSAADSSPQRRWRKLTGVQRHRGRGQGSAALRPGQLFCISERLNPPCFRQLNQNLINRPHSLHSTGRARLKPRSGHRRTQMFSDLPQPGSTHSPQPYGVQEILTAILPHPAAHWVNAYHILCFLLFSVKMGVTTSKPYSSLCTKGLGLEEPASGVILLFSFPSRFYLTAHVHYFKNQQTSLRPSSRSTLTCGSAGPRREGEVQEQRQQRDGCAARDGSGSLHSRLLPESAEPCLPACPALLCFLTAAVCKPCCLAPICPLAIQTQGLCADDP